MNKLKLNRESLVVLESQQTTEAAFGRLDVDAGVSWDSSWWRTLNLRFTCTQR